jgi:hypothetical protein
VGAIAIQALFSATRENHDARRHARLERRSEPAFDRRDFLRWALTEFRRAKIVHGHGTTSATDEAAFLILETLHLPVDDINPWLDATLLSSERQALANIIRAASKPACRPPIWSGAPISAACHSMSTSG